MKNKRVQQVSLAALVIGAGVIVVTLLTVWFGGSSSHDDQALTTPGGFGGSHGLAPRDTDLASTQKPEAITGDGVRGALTAGGNDPFANGASDQTLHKVVIRFTSDGALYAGWRYRDKRGAGSKIASRNLEFGRTVRGALPVAQAAVQVLQTATYAKCTIFVDGVAVATQTARGVNHVTVCIG